jgi:predicted dehydrogenase
MFRLGIVGLSRIAVTKVIPSILNESGFLISAIASQSQGTHNFNEIDNVIRYNNYYEILKDRNIDGLYVSLPNNMHANFVLQCISNKQNILIEKPLCLSVNEAEKIIKEYDNEITIMEGLMYKYHPQWIETIRMLRESEIGKPLSAIIKISYTCKDKNNIRFSKDLGGGALYDVGVYCFSMARQIFQQEPLEIYGKQFICNKSLVDITSEGTIIFEGGEVSFFASIMHTRQNYVEIQCENGKIILNEALNPPLGGVANIIVVRNKFKKKYTTSKCNQFKEQLEFFKKSCSKNDSLNNLKDSLYNIKAVEKFINKSEKQYVTE